MTILIVPGLHGSEPEHWQSRWEVDLDNVERVRQDNWEEPNLEIWLRTLLHYVERRPGAILVGHSLGTILIAHLASHYSDLDIAGALLVAPADPELLQTRIPCIASFAPLPASPFQFPATLVASRTDPYMAQAQARSLAKIWGATFVDAGDVGHINVASGHGSWPEGLTWLKEVARRQPNVGHSDFVAERGGGGMGLCRAR
ncbi:RBBP9/YdeN family alpha/beta hydrolase [Microvirga rosea]|uniref:RBBP9/YdeN family alpha/beta hydrolase n=1 Tax=Microvirga rosea TaxID=2715425 RepID=UPI001D0B2F50|nr:alpha/beta fold hydrolase [Microvirga rosea]MCB8821929.1 alpha/beta fold hydrolase [Microvirga rosea]